MEKENESGDHTLMNFMGSYIKISNGIDEVLHGRRRNIVLETANAFYLIK